jgi:hypothetical protein
MCRLLSSEAQLRDYFTSFQYEAKDMTLGAIYVRHELLTLSLCDNHLMNPNTVA